MTPEYIEEKNSQAFINFRVLFNCRLYYPIFTILFLDFGINLEEFSLLNVVWALSIVIFEVPSGALADLIGRKKLVVFAALTMMCEMLLLLLAPRSSPFVFWILLLNRILSGLAEASASGADEALTYDSLTGDNKEKRWNKLLLMSMKYQSLFMVMAMLLGAFLYDWNLLSRLVPSLEQFISKDFALRLPLFLNFILAGACFFTSLQFIEKEISKIKFSECKESITGSFRQMKDVAYYIFKSDYLFGLILFGLVFDSALRVFATLLSNYYRDLGIAESLYGIIGAAFSLLGVVSSVLGSRMTNKFSLKWNFTILGIACFLLFTGILWIHSLVALLLVLLFALSMYLLSFFMSYYINLKAPSEMRATLLSFKGLAFNLAYGWAGILFAKMASQNKNSFRESLPFFYKYFLGMFLMVLLIKSLRNHIKKPQMLHEEAK